MSEQPMTETYACEVCKAGIGGNGSGVTVGPLKCWRDDCPGGKPQPKARLTLVPDAAP